MRSPLLRRLLAVAAVTALALVTAGAAVAEEQTAAKRPNVVVIMTDDMRADDLSVMPNVRSLIGEQGVTFANSFASYPLCCPSRAPLLTGQYSHNHGVEFNAPPHGGYHAFDNTTALPVALQQAGYHTIHIGKFLNGYGAEDPLEVPPGWSDWRASVDPSTYTELHPQRERCPQHLCRLPDGPLRHAGLRTDPRARGPSRAVLPEPGVPGPPLGGRRGRPTRTGA